MADNYFYFDNDYINEIPEGLKDFAVEFPLEYWSYKLYLTNDNADKTIKINDFEIVSHKHDFELT